MDLDLLGKTFIVTGGTDGLGLASARALIAEGANVLVTGRTKEKFVRVRDALRPDADRIAFRPATPPSAGRSKASSWTRWAGPRPVAGHHRWRRDRAGARHVGQGGCADGADLRKNGYCSVPQEQSLAAETNTGSSAELFLIFKSVRVLALAPAIQSLQRPMAFSMARASHLHFYF